MDKQVKQKVSLLISLSLLVLAGCQNYRFEQKFKPLLLKDSALNEKYSAFEDSLPNDKHYTQNIAFLNDMINGKTDILNNLKPITPTKDYADVYNTFIEDLNNSIEYLKKEVELFEKNTEYGVWLAQSLFKGSLRHRESGPELVRAKQAVLNVQQELTARAEKGNASQERLKQLVLSKKLLRKYDAVRYAKYQKDSVGFRIR